MGTPTVLYLVRHGESMLNTAKIVQGMSNDLDNHLTKTGRDQAESLAREFTNIPFVVCYCSPHVRTKETAHILLSGRTISTFTEQNLQEKRQGSMTGMTKKDFFARYKEWNSITEDERLNIKIVPDEESQGELWSRAKQILLAIASKHCGQCVLVVTHGGLMRSVYQHIMDISFVQMWSFHNCGYMKLVVLENKLEIELTSGLHRKEVKDFWE